MASPLVFDEELIRKLPKAELHMHLDGSVRPSTVLELAEEQGVTLPTTDLAKLTSLIRVGDDCTSLVEYLEAFSITNSVTQKAYALTRITYELCEDCVADGISYCEIRFSPVLHTNEQMNLSTVMEAVIEGIVLAELHLPITPRVIVCGMRHLSPEVTAQLAEIAWRYQHRGVVGFDLAGPEDGFTSERHKHAFEIVRKRCLNVTLHAGENAGVDSIQNSLQYCGAQRIGHATRLVESDELLEYVVNRQVPLECCITSNYHTKATPALDAHPLRTFLARGAVVTLCTDNRTVSDVTLSGEYALAARIFSLEPADVLRLIDNGFRSAFVDSGTRERLRLDALRRALQVLEEGGVDVQALRHSASHLPHFVHYTIDLSKTSRYWEGYVHPPITSDVVHNIPKTDLHCRFHGSVSVRALLREVELLSPVERTALGLADKTKEYLEDLQRCADCKDEERYKQLQYQLLQRRDQIERGVDDILRTAVGDNVTYMELMVRPDAHTKGGLTEEEVVDAVLQRKRHIEAEGKIAVNLVIYCDLSNRDALAFQRRAEFFVAMAAKHTDVVGFGVFGADLKVEEYAYYKGSFDYLKQHRANVVMNAGRSAAGSVIEALTAGGAARVSGAFQVHVNPLVMSHLANRGIPVEIADTDFLAEHTAEVRSFVHPLRLYLDNQIRLCVCSFRNTQQLGGGGDRYRTDHLHQLVAHAALDMRDLLRLIGNGFEHSFAPRAQRIALHDTFWRTATRVTAAAGFKHIKTKGWFPPDISQ